MSGREHGGSCYDFFGMRGSGLIAALIAVTCNVRAASAESISARERKVARAEQTQMSVSAALGSELDPDAAARLLASLQVKNEPSVRRSAAFGLRKALTSRFRAGTHLRRQILSALQHSSRHDPSPSVRRVARESLAYGDEHAPPVTMNENATGFVTVAEFVDNTASLPRSAGPDMELALRQALKKHAPTVQVAAADKHELPTQADLTRARMNGYMVGGVISKLAVATRGNRFVVECAISLRVSPWEGRDGGERLRAGEAASASGKGRVDGARESNLDVAKSECVKTVVNELAARQVVPFLRTRMAGRR